MPANQRTETMPLLEMLEARSLLSDGTAAHGLGLRAPTAQDLAWGQQNLVVTQQVRLNALGLQRINDQRLAQGLPALDAATADLAPAGAEVVGHTQAQLDALAAAAAGGPAAPGGPAAGGASLDSASTGALASATLTPPGDSPAAQAQASGLPAAVDNSTLPYFPHVGDQGSQGSCTTWAGTYYAMTYMTAMARGWNVRDNPNDADHFFSPKWSYNMINTGVDTGSDIVDAYNLMLNDGAATWADVPYDGNYRAWVYDPNAVYDGGTKTSADVWREAIGYRMNQSGTVASVGTTAGLANLKTLLNDGYILNYATDFSGWTYKYVGDDHSTPADDPYVGQLACYLVTAGEVNHEMTVVGYNDDIWIDINGNDTVDAGEKGAVRIVNSWGTGWGNGGFAWLSYDALKTVSAVSDWTPPSRQPAWDASSATWITARSSYTPTVLAQFTIQHAARNQVAVGLGTGPIGATDPASVWNPTALQHSGGAYGFDGNTYLTSSAAPVGQFVMDYTGLNPVLTTATRYFLDMDDTSDPGLGGTILSFQLTDANGQVLTWCPTGPRPGDLPASDADGIGNPAQASIDYPGTEIRGAVYSDLNVNGQRDGGEGALPDWTVFQDDNANHALDDLTQTFTQSTALSIPDTTTVDSTLNISGVPGAIYDVNVKINITHGRDHDLTVTLISPAGTRTTLVDKVGTQFQTWANFTNTIFDDAGGISIYSGTKPFTGTYQPSQLLSGLNGQAASGAWRLEIYDYRSGYTGTLNNWSLTISARENSTLTDATGQYLLSRLTAGTVNVDLLAPAGYAVTQPATVAYTQAIAAMQVVSGRDFGAALVAPGGLSAQANGAAGTFALSWSFTAGSATGLVVDIATDPAFTQSLLHQSLAATALATTVPALADDEPWYFRVHATYSQGDSPFSATVGAVRWAAAGGGGNRSISLDPAGTGVMFYDLAADPSNPAFTIPQADFGSAYFAGGAGDDSLTVDFTHGDPLPAGGLSFDGGGNGLSTGDTLKIVGQSSAEAFALTRGQVTHGGRSIAYANLENLTLDAGAFTASADLGVPATESAPATADLALHVRATAPGQTTTVNLNSDQDLAALDVDLGDENGANCVVVLGPGDPYGYGPGGSVALWIYGGGTAPTSTPSRPQIDDLWSAIVNGYGTGGAYSGITTATVANPNANGLGLLLEPDSTGATCLGITEDILGDANFDFQLTAADVTEAVKHLNKRPAAYDMATFTSLEGDVNFDGQVTAADITILVKLLNHGYNPSNGVLTGGLGGGLTATTAAAAVPPSASAMNTTSSATTAASPARAPLTMARAASGITASAPATVGNSLLASLQATGPDATLLADVQAGGLEDPFARLRKRGA